MTPRKKLRMQTTDEVQWTYEVGQRLRRLRLAAGYTQEQFAKIIQTTQTQVLNAEQGYKALPLYPFFLACRLFKKDANSLMGRKKKREK